MAVGIPKFTEQRVALGGITLNVNSGGEGPPIIFLHGFPEQGKAWMRVAARLCTDHNCILPDQRGYNLSDKPNTVDDYRIDHLVGDIDALADARGIAQFALAGHDWGGALAWWYSAQRPERVSRLIIANAPHPVLFQSALFHHPAQRFASQYITTFRAEGSEERLMSDGADGLWDRLFAANPAFDDDHKAEFTSAWSQPGAMKAMVNWYRAAPFIVPAPQEEVAPPPAQDNFSITMPTLVLWGMRDTALLPVLLDGLADHVPDLRIKRFPDAGHAIIHEQPFAVAQAIREFIAP